MSRTATIDGVSSRWRRPNVTLFPDFSRTARSGSQDKALGETTGDLMSPYAVDIRRRCEMAMFRVTGSSEFDCVLVGPFEDQPHGLLSLLLLFRLRASCALFILVEFNSPSVGCSFLMISSPRCWSRSVWPWWARRLAVRITWRWRSIRREGWWHSRRHPLIWDCWWGDGHRTHRRNHRCTARAHVPVALRAVEDLLAWIPSTRLPRSAAHVALLRSWGEGRTLES